MKLNLSKEDKERVETLFAYKELNMVTNEVIRDYLQYNSRFIKAKMIKDINPSNEEKAFYYFLKAYFDEEYYEHLKLMGVDINYPRKMVHQLDPSKYENNPYNKNIKIRNLKGKDWIFKNSTYQPYEGFVYQDLDVIGDYYLEIPQIGFFDKAFKYLEVYQDGKEWMSITPNEIETMEEGIKGCYGDVVTYGLGLGYFAYMASLKENVKSVTIIELDKEVTNLFKENILPLFEAKDKIKIIQKDALEYAKEKHHHDYAFIDLWHDARDGLDWYLKLKKYEQDDCTYCYWIEKSILTLLRRAVLVVLEDELNGFDSKVYDNDDLDLLFKSISLYLKDYPVNGYLDIKKLLSEESLRELVKNL